MNYSIVDCIDAGSENCPCHLAATGDCLTCSRLQGKDYCDCNWKGVCVYSEFQLNQQKVNNPRKDFLAAIIEKKYYMEDLVVFVLDVGKGFAIRSSRPGSYLFLRKQGMEDFYQVPISVMLTDLEKGYIHLAIKIISLKTKTLLEENDTFIVKGPYRNGIQGLRKTGSKIGIDATSLTQAESGRDRILIVTRGIGIAPGIQSVEFFRNRQPVDLMVDQEKITPKLLEEYLSPTGGLQFVRLEDQEGIDQVREQCKKTQYHRVILLMSDYYLKRVGDVVRKILPNAEISLSNNYRLCCGEGVCGSCSIVTSAGETLKMCKCQIKGQEILDQRLI